MGDTIETIRFKFNKLRKKTKAYRKNYNEVLKKRISLAMVEYQNSVDKVLRAYNVGSIERYPGDFSNRQKRNSKINRMTNNPLMDTGAMAQKISFTIIKSRSANHSGVKGVLVFGARGGLNNAPYPRYLNDGTKNKNGTTRIKAYRFKEIALEMSKKKIIEILGGKYD